MSQLQRTLTLSAVTSGQGEAEYPSQQLVNTSAPEVGSVDLPSGSITITVPSGVTVTKVWIKAPPNSANNKVLKQVLGDTGSAPFTDFAVYPVTAGGTFMIVSASIEYGVKLIYC